MVYIGEKITAAVVFKDGVVLPRKFIWNKKEFTVSKIALSYTKKIGDSLFLFFSVEVLGGDGVYQLSFNSKVMTWNLEGVENA